MGFSMSKVWSPNYFFDRCVIENPDDPYSYALFDLVSKSGHDGWIFVAFDVQEYHLTADDEMLIRLSI